VTFLAPVRDYIDALVHPASRSDALVAARHRAFIAPRLIAGLVALAAFPIYLGLRGAPGAAEILVFVWAATPIAIAYFLSRTGRYEAAHILSFLMLTGLVLATAFCTGGIASFCAVWLVLVPLEAALSGSRHLVVTGAVLALAVVSLLAGLDVFGLLPHGIDGTASPHLLSALGLLSAGLYATALAFGAQSLAQSGSRLLGKEEDRYQLLARVSRDLVTRHGPTGAVLFASPAAEPLFGVAASDLLGHGLLDRVHVADRPAYLTALSDAASGEPRAAEIRIRGERSSTGHQAGCFHWVEMRCRPLEAGDGMGKQPREVIAVLRDIDDRKAQELALENARVESERASTAKTRFLATMSHELRTPLNVIIGFSDMLIRQSTVELDEARRQEYARLINESGRHLLAVVNGILDMSKIEVGRFEITRESFAVEQAVRHCCDLLRMKAEEKGVEIVMRAPAGLPEILADRRAINQILLNLLSNAIKFTDRGGRVAAEVGRGGGWILLTVEDTGIGMAPAELKRIGEPFFQARANNDRAHEGTGLGLSIVKGLVKLHGGQFEIRSHPGEGTRVTVKLPIGNAPALHDDASDPVHAFSRDNPIPKAQVKKIA